MRREQLPKWLETRVEFGSELPGSLCKKGSLISYRAPLISKKVLAAFSGERYFISVLVFFPGCK